MHRRLPCGRPDAASATLTVMGLLKLIRLLSQWIINSRNAKNRLRSETGTLRSIEAVMKAYRCGDYQAALRAADDFRQYDEVTAVYCFYRGNVLSHLGSLEDAKTWLLRSISLRDPEDKQLIAIVYMSLGQAL